MAETDTDTKTSFFRQLLRNQFLYTLQFLLALTIVIDYSLTNSINHVLGNWFYVLPAAALTLALLPSFAQWKLFKQKYLVMLIYHLVAGAFLVFLTSIFGPYFQVLILLLFGTAYWFKWPGLLVSLASQLIIILAAVWYQFGFFNSTLWYLTTIHFVILVIIGVLFEQVVVKRRFHPEESAALRQTVSFERTRLLSLINSMADAVIATDSTGRILLYNGAALALLNTNVSLEQRQLQDFLSLYDKDGKHVDLLVNAHKENRTIKRDDLHFISNENESVDVYVNISPIRSGFGNRSDEGFIIVLRDITREKTLDEERDEFISVTSHELRTPIAIAEANISTALHPNVGASIDPAAKQLLEQAHNNIIFLGDLVNDLTTLARAERGDLQVNLEPIDPVNLLGEIAKNYKKEAADKGLEIKVTVADKTPHILTSILYLREILQNFLTNAIKYTPKGSVTLGAQPGDRGRVVFSVADTGIGIAKADRAKVFSKFYRSEDYRTRQSRGTGLGLYITLKLAERLRGKVWFESELNRGSTFYLEIPPIGARRQDQAKVAKVEVKELMNSI